MKIDIATLQETLGKRWRMGTGGIYILCNFRKKKRNRKERRNRKAGDQKGIGGISIAIKNELNGNILGIERVNERIMKIRHATNIHGKK